MSALRPALGLEPRHRAAVIGRQLAVAVDAGTPLSWQMLCARETDGSAED